MTRRKIPLLLCLTAVALAFAVVGAAYNFDDAPAAFATPVNSNQSGAVSNGFTDNTTFAGDEGNFMEADDIGQGLGPIYNARACADCHATPNIGGTSQIAELRVGHNDVNGNFVNPTIFINDGANSVPTRSLVNQRAICDIAQERVPGAENIRTLRATTNALGDGFVEAIDSNTLFQISQNQPFQSGGFIAGTFIQVPVAEANGLVRGGRFGWKNQQASLLSFAADAYLNEQGITNRFNATDVTSVCKTTADPEDQPDAQGLADIDHQARFMRASLAIPRDAAQAATPDAQAGAQLFNAIGCAICHVRTFTT